MLSTSLRICAYKITRKLLEQNQNYRIGNNIGAKKEVEMQNSPLDKKYFVSPDALHNFHEK